MEITNSNEYKSIYFAPQAEEEKYSYVNGNSIFERLGKKMFFVRINYGKKFDMWARSTMNGEIFESVGGRVDIIH